MLNRNMFFLDNFTFFFSDQPRMVAMIEILWKMFIRKRQKKMISHTDIFFFLVFKLSMWWRNSKKINRLSKLQSAALKLERIESSQAEMQKFRRIIFIFERFFNRKKMSNPNVYCFQIDNAIINAVIVCIIRKLGTNTVW
ncbi:hypothetical protein NH340_JMT00295 [Sarcoptes scabiei]|nr:hypothetical protein NH340_JMT00295 [Sarcoptes scabiei]